MFFVSLGMRRYIVERIGKAVINRLISKEMGDIIYAKKRHPDIFEQYFKDCIVFVEHFELLPIYTIRNILNNQDTHTYFVCFCNSFHIRHLYFYTENKEGIFDMSSLIISMEGFDCRPPSEFMFQYWHANKLNLYSTLGGSDDFCWLLYNENAQNFRKKYDKSYTQRKGRVEKELVC